MTRGLPSFAHAFAGTFPHWADDAVLADEETGPISGSQPRNTVPNLEEGPTWRAPSREEIQALTRASATTFREFPPLLRTADEDLPVVGRSDAPILSALLRESEPDERSERLTFLGQMLANRGLPSLLLERHLMNVASELASVHTTLTELPRAAIESALELRSLREELLSPQAWLDIREEISTRHGGDPAAIELLMSAVLDELGGAWFATERTRARLLATEALRPDVAHLCVTLTRIACREGR